MKSILLGALASLLALSQGLAATPSGTQAVSANRFLTSLGVNVHVAQGYNPQNYIQPLKYLGVTAVRDYISDRLETLYQQAGVKLDVMLWTRMSSSDLTGIVLPRAKILAQHGALLSIEGANEPNNFPIVYNGQVGGGSGSWMPVARMQRDTYAAVKSDDVLGTYPVFAPSEVGAETDNVGLQFLALPSTAGTGPFSSNFSVDFKGISPADAAYSDYANIHNYVIGNGRVYSDNQAWNAADPMLNARWDGLYGTNGVTWRGHYRGYTGTQLQSLPRVTTETGWDSVSDPGGEAVQGKVLVNTYLAQWKRGWRYTFIYELGDGEGSQGHQGLFHTDWTPKLSATYIHNLTTILADPTPNASPSRLNFSTPNQPDVVHNLLLQKASGVYDLVIWGESVSATNSVTLTFPTPRDVKMYDVTVGTSPVRSLQGVTSVPLAIADHAIVLEIR